jgi:general stress protein 26
MSDVKNLEHKEAIEKLKELAEKIKVCMFCSNMSVVPFSTRPMGLSEVDADGKLWFLSATTSNKNQEIKQDEKVQLIFSDPSSSQFLSIFGEADIFEDEKSIEKEWTPLAKAWFPEGKEDRTLTVIKVHPLDAYYWDTKNGKMISLIKIAAAAITGNKPDAGIEGKLTVETDKF